MDLLVGWLQADIPLSPSKLWESGAIVVLETTALVVLWRAYREKGKALEELTRQVIETNEHGNTLAERIERLLESLK